MRLTLTERARRDLLAIVAYTLRHWGVDQSAAYERAINETFVRLLDNPSIGRSRDDLRKGLRGYRVERHYILYRVQDDALVVQRIIHERQSIERLVI